MRGWIQKAIVLFAIMVPAAGFSEAARAGETDPGQNGEWDFQLWEVWSRQEVGDDLLTGISDIQVADDGRIYAVEPRRFRVLILDETGRLKKAVGRKGEGPGEFRMIWSVQLSLSRMVVPVMDRVHLFSRGGEFQETRTIPAHGFPRHWLDDQRFLMITATEENEAKTERIRIYHLEKGIVDDLGEVRAGRDMQAAAGGIRLRVRDSRINPAVITGCSDKRIYYGFSAEYRIRSMDMQGRPGPTLVIEDRKPRPISMAAKRRRFENIVFNGGPMPEVMVDQMVKQIPDECTFFYRIRVDPSGKIWVFITDMDNRRGREVDIFSPDGRYLWHGELRLPEGLSYACEPAFHKGHMLVYAEDEDGEGRLVKYTLKTPGT